ncbi:hypothetical protein [Deinococcus sp. SL84]|uniref:hypothetical protein n=1 Tax=Deinococcus sp. SL84 TaxID=2994663 RepID=UPI002DD42DCF|nr:hypothetical protein [Deinococcus sp. SL84]
MRRLHLAHFGSYAQDGQHWDALLTHLNEEAEWVRERLARGTAPAQLEEPFTEWVLEQVESSVPGLAAAYRFASPPAMNVMGLARYWARQEEKREEH